VDDNKVVLWDHQKNTINQARGALCHGLFHDPGVGKTCTTIQILRELFTQHTKLLKTLIICPPIVLYNWKTEFAKFSKINPESIDVLYGHNAKRVKLLEDKGFFSGAGIPNIFIVNYEGLLMDNVFDNLMAWQPEVVIADELHRCKNPKSKRTKALIKLGDQAKYRYGLTGSPVLNSLMDMFAQIRFLDKGKTLGSNFFSFRARFMFDKNARMPKQRYFPNWVPQQGAETRLSTLISPFTSHVKKEECLDLPPLIEQDIQVEMSPAQAKMYKEMKQDFITWIESQEVVATMALTKLLRLQQMASGFCKTYEGKEIEIEGNPKAEACKELLSDLTEAHKVIVWCAWKANYATLRTICEELKIEYRELHGETPPTKKYQYAEEFCKNPKVRVLISNPRAAGLGINLVEASYSIVYSRTFSLEDEIQGIARNYRSGSEVHQKVTRINLVTKDTVDEIILDKLKKKEKIGDEVLSQITGRLRMELE